MQFFTKRTNKPTQAEINGLAKHYRNMILHDKAVELITKEDYNNLLNVANYADFGKSTAIQAAFCLGFNAGKSGAA